MSSKEREEPENVRLDRLGKDRAKAGKDGRNDDEDRGGRTASLGPGGSALDAAILDGDIEGDAPDRSD